MNHILPYDINYHSERYNKSVFVPAGTQSDGATGAIDIWTEAWWVHDELCSSGQWQDQTPVTAIQAANVLSDILKAEGHWLRCHYWKWATFFFGCNKAKENGWFRLKVKA